MARKLPTSPIPKSLRDKNKTLKEPYLGNEHIPDVKPNRGQITRRDDDKVGSIKLGLEDHNDAIVHYFNNVIKPSIVKDGNRIKVPLVYGSREVWKSVQKDGYLRDKEGKIQVPLIVFKRDDIGKNRELGNKLDGNDVKNYYIAETTYTKRNQYDNFSLLNNRQPVKEYHRIIIPDYITLKYTFQIWTDYVAHMDKIIEAIEYSSDSYWGDKDTWKFHAKIDSFSNQTEVNIGNDRIVRSSFGLTLNGYIIPEAYNKYLSEKYSKIYSKSNVRFKIEQVRNIEGLGNENLDSI